MENVNTDLIPIIGYGSLMDAADLQRTCPGAERIEVVTVTGWKRGLTLPALSPNRQCQVALAYPSSEHHFNAWLATIPPTDLEALDRREHQYQRERITAHNLQGEPIAAYIYRCEEKYGVPDFQNPHQLRYLRLCLGGCVGSPDDFWATFLKTTWVGDKSLMQLAPNLMSKDF